MVLNWDDIVEFSIVDQPPVMSPANRTKSRQDNMLATQVEDHVAEDVQF